MPTIAYVDGFNLYYGALKRTPYKWLDLKALCHRLLPNDRILQIRYFSALVSARPGNPREPERQQVYLRALATFPIITVHLGQYRSHHVRMPLAHPPAGGPRTVEVIKTEEKGSDVNLASHLLVDASRKRCDTALVISNDSDLREPVRLAEDEYGIKVGIVSPHSKLKQPRTLQATFYKELRRSALSSCQLPNRLHDKHGVIHKPPEW